MHLQKKDKTFVESQLGGFSIYGLYHDFLHIKVMRENSKAFKATVQSALAEQNLQKRFLLKSDDHDHPKWRLVT